MPTEFVDTNILVYAYDWTAENKFDHAQELMEKLWDSGEGVVSSQVLEEFYVTGQKYGEITVLQSVHAVIR